MYHHNTSITTVAKCWSIY